MGRHLSHFGQLPCVILKPATPKIAVLLITPLQSGRLEGNPAGRRG